MKRLTILVSLALVAPALAAASDPVLDNWPQWRGPHLNGVSDAKGLPTTWSTEQNVVWKTALPHWSAATPAIWGDRIYLISPEAPAGDIAAIDEALEPTDQRGQRRRGGGGGGGQRGGGLNDPGPGGDALLLFCINRTNGEIIFRREVDRGNRQMREQNAGSPSPVTDGEHVWTMTANGELTCWTMVGEKVWSINVQRLYGNFGINWGYASSPLLYEDRLIVPVLHGMRTDDPSYVMAVNKTNGEVIWRTERPTPAQRESPDAYVTPQVMTHNGRTEIILNGGDLVTGHDMATGSELWRADVLNPRDSTSYRIVPSSLIVGDIIIAPTRERPMTAMRAGGSGDVTSSHVAWQTDFGPDVPTPVSDGSLLYVVREQGQFTALDVKTGEPKYEPQRLATGTYRGSPLLADGKVYITQFTGVTSVLQAGPEFTLLATNELDGSKTYSSPIAVDNQIFIRTAEFLYCISESQR
jgi:outer membrane protein assembly factor BamB